MASVTRLPHGNGWQVRWKSPDRHSRKKNFRTKPDAQRFAASVEVKKATGDYVDPAEGKRLFSDYSQAWMKVKAANVTERTWINQEGRLRNHLLPVLGDRQLAAITPEDVRLLVGGLTTEKHLEAATVRPVYFLLRRILATAVVDGLIARSPCVKVELPAEEQGDEMLFLTPEQLARLADTVDPRYRALILTAGYSGLRAGELSALKVERVHFLRRRLAVVEAHSEVHGRLVTKSTKTRRRREVPIPQSLVDVLAEHLARYPSPDGFVFTAAEGGPVRHRNFYRRHYKPAVERAELPLGLRFHDLRHTAAAILIEQGCNEKQLSTFLGDTSRAIERYKHLFDGHEEALMKRVDATLSATVGSIWGPTEARPPYRQPAKELDQDTLGAEDGIRTRDPHLGKVMRYRCATSALGYHFIASTTRESEWQSRFPPARLWLRSTARISRREATCSPSLNFGVMRQDETTANLERVLRCSGWGVRPAPARAVTGSSGLAPSAGCRRRPRNRCGNRRPHEAPRRAGGARDGGGARWPDARRPRCE